MKRMLQLLLTVFIVSAIVTGCGNKEKPDSSTTEGKVETGSTASEGADTSKQHVKINIKDYGSITVELDAKNAPITVENFISLVNDKFYDGLTFHRIISDFMVQGGDPLGTGMGGSDKTIKGEFSSNGVENMLSHTRGVISMARSQQVDSASSQFFIVHNDSTFLDGEYAAFGYVTDGMDIVDKICADIQVEDDNGTVASENQPIIESIELID